MLNIDDRLIKEICPKIKPNGLAVLLAIAIHLNQKTNRCFPSHERIMALTGLGRDAVYSALQTLKENKLLTSHQPIDEKTKKFGRRTFKLTTRFVKIFVDAEDAEPLPEIPFTETPDTVEPDTENKETKPLNNNKQINQLEQISKEEEKAASLFFSSSQPENSILKAEKKEVGTSPGAGGAARENDYDFIACDACNGAGFYYGRNGRETCEKCAGSRTITKPKNGALEPPFTPIGTIEPQGATIVRMYSPEHPDFSIVDSVPGTYTPQTDERSTPPEALQRVNIPEQIAILKNDAAALETFAIVRKIPSNLYPEYVEAFSKEIAGTGETYFSQKNFRKHFFNWSGTRYEIAQRKATKFTGQNRSGINHAGGDAGKYEEKQRF